MTRQATMATMATKTTTAAAVATQTRELRNGYFAISNAKFVFGQKIKFIALRVLGFNFIFEQHNQPLHAHITIQTHKYSTRELRILHSCKIPNSFAFVRFASTLTSLISVPEFIPPLPHQTHPPCRHFHFTFHSRSPVFDLHASK